MIKLSDNFSSVDCIDADGIRLFLFGLPKIGKTFFCSCFKHVFFIKTDKRKETIPIRSTIIDSWTKFSEVVDIICDGNHKYKTFAIDTADNLYTFCEKYVCKYFEAKFIADIGFGKGYRMLESELNRVLGKLFLSEYGLIFTSHSHEVEITKKSGKITRTSSTLDKRLKRILLANSVAIGNMESKTIEINGEFKHNRVILFESNEFAEVGDGYDVFNEYFIVYKDRSRTYNEICKLFNTKFKGGGSIER